MGGDAKEYNVLQVTLGWIPFWHDSVQVDLSIGTPHYTHITLHTHHVTLHTQAHMSKETSYYLFYSPVLVFNVRVCNPSTEPEHRSHLWVPIVYHMTVT